MRRRMHKAIGDIGFTSPELLLDVSIGPEIRDLLLAGVANTKPRDSTV
jgi:hypothetical protein